MMFTRKKIIYSLIIFTILFSPLSLANEYAAKDPVYHVVLVWLKKYRDNDRISKIIEESKVLEKIPGVLSVNPGKVHRSSRVIVDDTFDVGIIIKFATAEDLKNYLIHPIHVKLVNDVIKPLANKVLVYDIVVKDN